MPCGCNKHTCNHCACKYPTNTDCVTYKGDAITDCDFDIVQGDTLTTIIQKITTKVCDGITPPSGNTYVVESCDSNITVSSTAVGTETTFEVCLSDTVTNQIQQNTDDISSIQTCLDSAITSLQSDTLTVFEVGANGDCGKTWQIELTAPSGSAKLDGIVNSDTTAATLPNGSGGDQIVKSFNKNYIADSDIQDGDEIRFYVSGKIKGGATLADSIKIELYDQGTATVLGTATFSSFTNATDIISSYWIEGILVVDKTNSQGLFTVTMRRNMQTAGVDGDDSRNILMIDKDVSSIDYSNLTIRVKQVNDSLYDATNNNVRRLVVEVRKKI